VDAAHVNVIWLLEILLADRPLGALGACVSSVVAVAIVEYGPRFPAASTARTL
jgi:hypothetical protein